MNGTIRSEKKWHGRDGKFVTRQEAAKHLGLSDGSHIDRIMAGYPVLMMPRKDGKAARMYHMRDIITAYIKRSISRHNAPELFDRKTIKATAKDKRKAQQDADIRTLINMKEVPK